MIQGEKTWLRAMEPDDATLLYEWENDPAVWRYGATSQPLSLACIKNFVENSDLDIYQSRQFRLMIVDKQNRETVGCIDVFDFDPLHLHASVAVLVCEPFRGRGFASDALVAFTDFLFRTFSLHTLCATIADDNVASIRLFEGRGFRRVGIRPQWFRFDGCWHDELVYILSRE